MFEHDISMIFAKAGFTRWPLLVCSAVGLAIIVERALYFYRTRLNYKKFSRDLFIFLNENRIMEAIHYCDKRKNPVAYMAGIFLKHFKNKKKECVLSREGTSAMERVENRLRGLTAIIHMAPLLGLLGTVAGLVVAFHEIEIATGAIQAKNLAGGIWEALLSTVFGLIVAIPCMGAYYCFESISDRTFRRVGSIIHELEEFFGNRDEEELIDKKIFKQEVQNV